MDAREIIRRRWREADELEGDLLNRLGRERGELEDELQSVLDRFSRLELSGNLPKREVEALHRAIQRWKKDGLSGVRPLKLYLNDLENRSRIRGEEALFLWLFAAFAVYYRRVEEMSSAALTQIAQAAYDSAYREVPMGRERYRPPDESAVKRLLESSAQPGGEGLSDGLQIDAEYRARQLVKVTARRRARDVELDLGGVDYRKALRAQEAWLLRDSPNEAIPGNHAGYIDMVMSFIVGQTVAQAFVDRSVKRYQFIATVDERTTNECRSLHLQVLEMADLKLGINAPPVYPPPHPCRSVIRAVADDGENAIIEFREITLFRGERNLVGRAKETAIVYDENGNELLRKYGEVGKVRFTSEEAAKLRGNTLSHNHPDNGPPSPADLYQLYYCGLKEVRALTTRGVYSIRAPEKWGIKLPIKSQMEYEFFRIGGEPLQKAGERAMQNSGRFVTEDIPIVEAAVRELAQKYGITLEFEEWGNGTSK